MNIKRISKFYYIKLVRLRGSPQSLARGASVGVFIGITPTIPFHTIMIFFAALMTRSSFLAALVTSWLVCNPLTYVPQYFFSYKIGNLVTPWNLSWLRIEQTLETVLSDATISERMFAIFSMGLEAILVLLVGGVLLAIPFTVASYYFFYALFRKIHQKRSEKHILY